jgi:hypothetical protein
MTNQLITVRNLFASVLACLVGSMKERVAVN